MSTYEQRLSPNSILGTVEDLWSNDQPVRRHCQASQKILLESHRIERSGVGKRRPIPSSWWIRAD